MSYMFVVDLYCVHSFYYVAVMCILVRKDGMTNK